MNDETTKPGLHQIALRLRAKGLFANGDSLSQRLAGKAQIAVLTMEGDDTRIVVLPMDQLQPGSKMEQHLEVYRNRPDVGAVLLNQQPWTRGLKQQGDGMPGIFDEQIRHLGTRVAVMAHQTISVANCAFLQGGANAFVLEKHVLCLGMTIERLVFNAELLEKCAKAFLLASSTGKPIGKIPWLIRWVAIGRLMKDERHATEEYAAGRTPVFKSAY